MEGIGRRSVLKKAVLGGVILPGFLAQRDPREIREIGGRPIRRTEANAETASDRQHTLVITLPAEVREGEPFKLTISMPEHPIVAEHHITWMRLFLDEDAVSFVTIAPFWQKPEVTFTLTLSKGSLITAVAECNMDGLWGTSVPLVINHPEARVESTE